MSYPRIVAGTLLAASVAVGTVATAGAERLGLDLSAVQLASERESGEDEYREDEGGMAKGPAMSIEAVLKALEEQGYSDVREVEREDGRYEVKARDAEGRWRELYVDGATGKVLKSERED